MRSPRYRKCTKINEGIDKCRQYFHYQNSRFKRGNKIMLTSKLIMEKIENNFAHIKNYGIEKIGLFGSYVRNEQKTKSDIDILMEFEKGKKTFDNYMDLKFFLEELFKCKVDLIISEKIKPDLKPNILGNVIYASGV